MNRALLLLEYKQFFRSPLCALAAVITFVVSVYALTAAGTYHGRNQETHTDFTRSIETRLQAWHDELTAIETGEDSRSAYAARPMNLRFPATLPPAPLAEFAVGAGMLLPHSAAITPWKNTANLFTNYQFANPTLLRYGTIDMSFVIVILLPLVMIAVSFDILAADRSTKRLQSILSQSIGPGQVMWTRLVFRNGVVLVAVLLPVLAVALAGGGFPPSTDRLARFAIWLIAAGVYAVFWLAVIAFVATRVRRAETVAATLVTVWGLLTLAIPAVAGTVGEAAFPTPSRLAYLSAMRSAQADANREVDRLTAGFLLDHPELTVGDESVPAYYRAAYLANREVETRTSTILEQYERALEGRRQFIGWLQYLSPAIVAQNALSAAAGADADRYYRFQKEARGALRDLSALVGPAVVARQRITLADFDRYRPYAFEETPTPDLAGRLSAPVGFLVLLSAFLLWCARARLNGSVERLL